VRCSKAHLMLVPRIWISGVVPPVHKHGGILVVCRCRPNLAYKNTQKSKSEQFTHGLPPPAMPRFC
jgi:hypothetical protein